MENKSIIKIKKRIIELREELTKLYLDESVSYQDVLVVSEELDELVNQYQKMV